MAVPRCNAEAAAAKEAGNKAFSAGRFEEAIELFTEAISKDPSSALLYSNRAAALSSLSRHADALADAEKCVLLQPDWWKGHTRKGHAEFQLHRYAESEASFREALRLNPQERAISEGLERARQARQAAPSNEAGDLRAAAGGPVPSPGAPPVVAPASTSGGPAFERRSDAEIQQQLQRGVERLDDAALDAELGNAGVVLRPNMTRTEKERLLLQSGHPAAVSSKGAPAAQVNSGLTRGEKLLERRRRWVEEWSTWDDAKLVKRLRKLGIDAEGCDREDLIDLLLDAETERHKSQCCSRNRTQVLGLLAAAVLVFGTFVGVVVWFLAKGGE